MAHFLKNRNDVPAFYQFSLFRKYTRFLLCHALLAGFSRIAAVGLSLLFSVLVLLNNIFITRLVKLNTN